MATVDGVRSLEQHPDKTNIMKVLRNEKPARPTLFEFFMNNDLEEAVTRGIEYDSNHKFFYWRRRADSFRLLGYDYVTLGCHIPLPLKAIDNHGAATVSKNEQAVIFTMEDAEAYPWPNPDECEYGMYEDIAGRIPDGMGIIASGPGGIEELMIDLMGYEPLCFALIDEPELAQYVADKLGALELRHYEIAAESPCVDALLYHDDWGFNQQTIFSPANMRKYLYPWVRRIVETAHAHGKPIAFHSCGNLSMVMDDIVDDLKFDAKHSYQDAIQPVESFYEQYGERIAVLGGIDLDYVIRYPCHEVYNRSCAMLEKSAARGGYALGTGNSVPAYCPTSQYLAMIAAALFNR